MTLNKAKLKEMPIYFPSPAEQRRIVGILDDAFAGVTIAKANTGKNLQNARALFESRLQSVFTQGGKGWVEKNLGDMVVEGALAKPFYGNHGEIHPRKADYIEAGVPFIMACDLHNGRVDTEHCTFISRKLADSLRVGFAKLDFGQSAAVPPGRAGLGRQRSERWDRLGRPRPETLPYPVCPPASPRSS